MAKDFSFTVTFEHPADQVHQALTSPEMWEGRVEGAHNAAVTTESREAGTLDITVTQHVAGDALPAIVRKAMRGDLSIVRKEAWGSFDGTQAQARWTAESTGITSRTEGTSTLRADGDKAVLAVEGRSEVKARLVGGAIEPMLVQMITNLVKSEREGTDKWLEQRSS
ncbi:DUF2505 domain-containing protein [Hoyosella sp. YIM 151337]|uniref:DUF2505 domain-containing protein n=1 Tax=Hoyosella sp. YIM 151337 TaxID=2992742 RepID=UPI002235C9ED|nr:DUF2505 domain-containing protein [Hoyosella sp. YIM 151337]MCW4351749.1 DUF2505 domain-containing protein [Hoyosella sp. YIM 151337]